MVPGRCRTHHGPCGPKLGRTWEQPEESVKNHAYGWLRGAAVDNFCEATASATGCRGMRLDVTPDALVTAGASLRRAALAMQASRRSMTVNTTALTGDLPRGVAADVRECEHSWARGLDRLTAGYDELADALDRVAEIYRQLDREVVR